MKRLFYFLIIPFSYLSSNAQILADASTKDTLTSVQNNFDDLQDYADDLPWHARRFKFTAGAFFPVNNTQVEVGTNTW